MISSNTLVDYICNNRLNIFNRFDDLLKNIEVD